MLDRIYRCLRRDGITVDQLMAYAGFCSVIGGAELVRDTLHDEARWHWIGWSPVPHITLWFAGAAAIWALAKWYQGRVQWDEEQVEQAARDERCPEGVNPLLWAEEMAKRAARIAAGHPKYRRS